MSETIITVFGLGAPTRFSPSTLGKGVGGHAARIASERGFTVRAVARNPAKYEEAFKDVANLSLVQGDVTNAESVSAAVQGATAAIFAAQASDGVSARDLDRDALILVAKECAKANVKLIVISSAFVSPKHFYNPLRGIFNTIIKWRMMDAKWEGEQGVRAVEGLRYTIIRPGGLNDKEAVQHAYKIDQGDKFMTAKNPIPKIDVGKVAVAAAVDPASDNVTFEMGGPQTTDPVTVDGIFNGLKKDGTY